MHQNRVNSTATTFNPVDMKPFMELLAVMQHPELNTYATPSDEPLDLSINSKASEQQQQQPAQQISIKEFPWTCKSFMEGIQLMKMNLSQLMANPEMHDVSITAAQFLGLQPAVKRAYSFENYNDEVEIQTTKSDMTKMSDGHSTSTETLQNNYPRISPHNTNFLEIGPNGTLVDAAYFGRMNWTAAPIATRALLLRIFSSETLETHSLTGKPSPAFLGRERPSKHRLDEKAVADIIHCISVQCPGSTVQEIRRAITMKCAEMAKTKRYNLKKLEMKRKLSSDAAETEE